MRDVGERTAMHQRRGACDGLHQIGHQRVAQQHRHGAVGLQVARGDRRSVAALCDDDPAKALLQVVEVTRQDAYLLIYGGFARMCKDYCDDMWALNVAECERTGETKDEASALHEMLEDLPEIFERKFRQRLQGVMEQQQRLLADNQALRDRLYALQPAGSEAAGLGMRLLPPASGPDPDDSEARPPLRRWIKGVMQRGREWMPGRASASSDDDDLSDRDGERPTAA